MYYVERVGLAAAQAAAKQHEITNADERLIRKELVRVWSKTLKEYAKPGRTIPPVDTLRKQLIDIGTEAAVDAIVHEHWFVFGWMVRDKIRTTIENGFARFDLADFIEDVKETQRNPQMLEPMLNKIKKYVLEEL